MDKLKVYRSNDYRQQFFDNNKPAIGNRYFCIYCGKPLKENKTQVDHILGIKYAKKHRRRAQLVAQMKGFSDINDLKNLGAACQPCNGAKGQSGGMWIWRGYMGKSNTYQWVRWAVRIALIVLFIVVVVYFGFIQQPELEFFGS